MARFAILFLVVLTMLDVLVVWLLWIRTVPRGPVPRAHAA